jgi:hypothetical protein
MGRGGHGGDDTGVAKRRGEFCRFVEWMLNAEKTPMGGRAARRAKPNADKENAYGFLLWVRGQSSDVMRCAGTFGSKGRSRDAGSGRSTGVSLSLDFRQRGEIGDCPEWHFHKL